MNLWSGLFYRKSHNSRLFSSYSPILLYMYIKYDNNDCSFKNNNNNKLREIQWLYKKFKNNENHLIWQNDTHK